MATTTQAKTARVARPLPAADAATVLAAVLSLTVLWQNDDGADTVVHARHSSDGGTTWGAAVAVSAAAQDPEIPQLELARSGADWLPAGTLGLALLVVGAALVTLQQRRPAHDPGGNPQ